MKKISCAAIIILFAVSLIGISYADTGSESKFSGPAKKAVRGGMNLLCGWTDIPRSIFEVTMDTKNAVLGLTVGAWQGFKKAFPRTVSGAVDLATFPIPDYEKSPVKPDPLVESGTARASAPATK